MYSEWVIVVLGLMVVWILGLSYFVLQEKSFLRELFPRSGHRDIRRKFEELLESISGFDQELKGLKKRVADIEIGDLGHISRVELLRYNPYNETGGDQSFSVALLNGKGTGLVVTRVHSRSGTRVFAKPVIEGKSGKHNFSDEEKEVVKKAYEH